MKELYTALQYGLMYTQVLAGLWWWVYVGLHFPSPSHCHGKYITTAAWSSTYHHAPVCTGEHCGVVGGHGYAV